MRCLIHPSNSFFYIFQKLIKKMKINPSEAIYIGDRFYDVEFAREAGCVAVAIHNKCSWSSLARIKKEGPDFIVRDFYKKNAIIGIVIYYFL